MASGNTIDSNHRGSAVNITVWLCFIFSALFIVAKIYTKLSRRKTAAKFGSLGLDDALLSSALLFSLAYSVVISKAVRAGFGNHLGEINPELIVSYEKLEYSSHFLYIGAVCVANAAGMLFGLMLGPTGMLRQCLHGLIGINLLWALTCIFAVAFQCHPPNTWQALGGMCLNQAALWTSIELLNIVINILLAAVLVTMIWILQLRKARYLLTLLFIFRTLIIIPAAFKIKYLQNYSAQDATFDGVNITIASILIYTLSIVATCSPFMKPVIEQLQPGWSAGQVHSSVSANKTGKGLGSSSSHILAIRDFEVSTSRISK